MTWPKRAHERGTSAAALAANAAPLDPHLSPAAKSVISVDPTIEARITGLIGQTSIEEKVGQIIQPEWKTITLHLRPALAIDVTMH
jgi:hypothetical protein